MPTPITHKGQLHQYIQKESLQRAIYRTVNEGSEHLPRFRSTVLVGEEQFTSPNIFLHIKEAEHDVAKIALESLRPRVKEEDFSLIHESTVLCKSILHEYAVKMQLEKPVYYTVQTSVQPPSFVSSLVINGVTYVGKNARTKKEAEQLVAQSVLLAISGGGESTSKTTLSKIICPKSKYLAALPKDNGFQNAESSTSTMMKLPVAFVPSNYVPPADVGHGSAKRKKKNKKKRVKKRKCGQES